MFLLPPPHHRHHNIEVTNSLLCRHTQYYGCRPLGSTRCLVNELAERPRPSFEAKSATLSLTRQSRALTTELERATCGKLRCRGPFSSFLTNPFICFECYSNIERINEGIISNAKHERQSRIPETPLSLSQ